MTTKDSSLVERLASELQRAQKELEDFPKMEVFNTILKAFDKPYAVQTDSENCAYFFEAECRRLGLSDVSLDELMMFFNVMGDTNSPLQEPGTFQDTSDHFGSFLYKIRGLWVSVLIGQGSVIYVGNDRAKQAWDID